MQKESRIPYALPQKVDKKLEQLELQDLIRDVTNDSTPWIKFLAISPDVDNIALCVDMRC